MSGIVYYEIDGDIWAGESREQCLEGFKEETGLEPEEVVEISGSTKIGMLSEDESRIEGYETCEELARGQELPVYLGSEGE